MTKEANAAIEGALAAGATEIVVRDSHGSKTNLLPEELNRNAKLVRGVDTGPKNMVLPIDETFDAAVFVGYHAKAGTPNAIMEHTASGKIMDVSINGVSLPEAGYNALIAGLYGVPVVFVAGDRAVCEQAKELFGEVETVAVKEALGNVAVNLHPEVARERIRAGVEKALRNLEQYKPYRMTSPYTMKLQLKREAAINDGALYPGAERTGDWELTFASDDLLEVMKFFNANK
jgi:D-amino peptidase